MSTMVFRAVGLWIQHKTFFSPQKSCAIRKEALLLLRKRTKRRHTIKFYGIIFNHAKAERLPRKGPKRKQNRSTRIKTQKILLEAKERRVVMKIVSIMKKIPKTRIVKMMI